MNHRDAPRVFTIAPGASFLKTLAEKLCDGTLIEGFKDTGDPLCLSDVTIYVPTRRAARTLRSIFTERNTSKAAILPTIRPLGEVDDNGGFFDEPGAASLTLDPPIQAEERILELAKLVQRWAAHLPNHVRAMFGTDPLVLPSTPADAVWLARNLADLMDEVARENGDWTALDGLVPEELAGWWQLTLEFVAIVSKHWPHYLSGNQLSDPVAYRNAIIQTETERLQRVGSKGPVIAAGSTGSVPATAELLKVIAGLDQGAVVLPGLDKEMDDEAWASLTASEKTPSVFGHPQFGLKKLLAHFGMTRDEVSEIGAIADDIQVRNRLISQSLMPAQTTYKWNELRQSEMALGLKNVSEIVAASEAQEAVAIAIALREAIETNAVPAALVTTDRILARRVSAELERFGIKADDSGGSPLEQSPPVTLFRLLLNVVFRPADPVDLLALLKHPLTHLGAERAVTRRNAEVLELLAMRGGVVKLQLPEILRQLKSVGIDRDDPHTPDYIRRLKAAPTEQAVDLAEALATALEPLVAFANSPEKTNVAKACAISVSVFEAIGRDNNGSVAKLYEGDAGEAFAQQLRALVGAASDFAFSPHEWPSIFNALIAGQSVKPRTGSDPRIHIWGALEARLQSVETLILGGLNEKTWPARPADDPLLSRTMKEGIKIEPPERRIGLAAHDFQMLMGAKRVVLSRAGRSEGSPSVPSRWVQRLHALIGKSEAEALQHRAANYLHWGRNIDLGLTVKSEPRPCPTPALHLRPKSFSISDISTLRRDPYAIHAKRILGLQALEPLLQEAGNRERGDLFHAIVEEFVRNRAEAPGTLEDLVATGNRLFDEAGLPDDTHILWWRRFERMAAQFLDYEAQRADMISSSHVELPSVKIPIDQTGATLHGKADRIDLLPGGSCEVIDYKTGSAPSAKQVLKLLEPQLPLEAALLARGGFFGGKHIIASDLAYVELKADGTVKPTSIIHSNTNKPPETAAQLGERAWEELIRLVMFYGNENNGYISRKAPFKEAHDGDYDHLARVAEWSGGGDDDDEAETP